MNKNNKKISLLLFTITSSLNAVSYALPYNVVPKAGLSLPTQIIVGNTVKAFYTVTNNTGRTLPNGFVKYLPTNVSQVVNDANHSDLCGAQFTLASGASCTLELTISGAVNSRDPDPHRHLFVCSPNVPACAGTTYPLNVKAIPPTISGVVQSGSSAPQSIANAHVTIYRADLSSATPIGEAETDSSGRFYIYIPPEKRAQATSFYAIARIGNAKLATILGGNILPSITINELTTVSAAYSMAQFFNGGQIFGKELGLKIASGMNDNLVSPVGGNLSTVILSSPNADQTNTKRSLNNLANLIAPCVRNVANACSTLFGLTTIDTVAPTNTLDALLNIAHNPTNNLGTIYTQSGLPSIYTPLLTSQPDAWTLAVKFNNSGNLNYLIGGVAKTVFDKNGYAWITNNVVQGTPDSSNWIIVLKPNGQPADGANNTPTSPIFGGGLLGNAFGITIDSKGSIWTGNFGWGTCPTCLPPGGEGSVTQLSSTGIPISGPLGYVNSLYRAQGTVVDKNDNIWMASYGNDRVVVYLNGDPSSAVFYQEPVDSGPFDIAIAQDGSAWVTNTKSGIINKYKLNANNTGLIKQPLEIQLDADSRPKAVSLDSEGNAWVAATGGVLGLYSAVHKITPQGTLTSYTDGRGGISGPWGITVDGDDNIWVANFEAERDVMPVKFSVSKLCGIKNKCPSGLQTGDAISPPTGYTLPSAGEEVLLADGTPLRGLGQPASYHPLMRLTHAISDQAGNVWAANNWKPLPYNINTGFNPGGDGMVVFIGIASPPNTN